MTDFSEDQILHIKKIKNEFQNKFFKSFNVLGLEYVDVKNNFFVSGGCFASLFQGEEPKDFDIYFTKKDNLFLVEKDNIADIDENYELETEIKGKMVTANAITLKAKENTIPIQLITKIYGEPEELRKSFDYVHCMPYFMDGKFYISKEQYICCVSKFLKINNSNIPEFWRKQKFKERGYTEYNGK